MVVRGYSIGHGNGFLWVDERLKECRLPAENRPDKLSLGEAGSTALSKAVR